MLKLQATSTVYAQFWKCFGPGLLFAGSSIGVSHLIQSTRAGAMAGLALSGVILCAIVLKYPFFEFAPRYTAATGRSLIEGYRRIGRWALWTYVLFTVFSSIIIQTAVILFTSYLLQFVFGLSFSLSMIGGMLCLVCGLLLWIGRFQILDKSIKVILLLLACSTLAAAVMIVPRVDFSTAGLWVFDGAELIVPLGFLLALIGWMPTAIDLSVWSSLWTLAKNRASGVTTNVATARLDFQIGYFGTGIAAFAFVIIGAGVMHSTGETLSAKGTVFSTQLINLYTIALGEWIQPIVIVAVLTTMLSTSLTVVDGFPRALDHAIRNLKFPNRQDQLYGQIGPLYWIILVILAVLTVVALEIFSGNMTTMVDFATIMSFLTAPILGYLNLRAVCSDDVPPEHQPGPAMRMLSYAGLLFMGVLALTYIGFRVYGSSV
ncbi:MAG: transporter [Nitrospiraceae bacterium]|nr:transporter [Nitrospiraceae bacterium]|tara:strand:+ start:873 stop:2168 length:1296 start_codon:yes stop_codon:yes gene_type:complete